MNERILFSVLDLAPIVDGGTATDSFSNSLDLAQHAEKWGFHRYWFAEHHNMPGIASSATSVVIGFVAGGTSTIRVGAGGIMLPNHAPLVIAEQFGTLESLYPGRIDLGLGRAPGSDQLTARALCRNTGRDAEQFPEQLEELRAYFQPASERAGQVSAFPGEGLKLPIWLLGSSGFSARLAAELGLPFAFASHFAPDYTLPALALYREHFQPSEVLAEPRAMVGVNIIAADTDKEARFLATSQQQQFLSLVHGRPTQLQPPSEHVEQIWAEAERTGVARQLRYTIVGNRETVQKELTAFLGETEPDEVIVNSQIFDHEARLRSYEIVSQLL